jgi:2'-5' RNA ligase
MMVERVPIGSTGDTQPIRVFVGLKIDAEIAGELARLARPLEGALVRLVPAMDIHVTLVPPWNESCVPAAIDKLRRALGDFKRFSLTFEKLRYAPTCARPRLLWVECAKSPELARLRTLLLETFGQTDDRPFRPHVTLARIHKNGPAIARNNPLSATLTLTQPVTTVELFQSPRPGESGYKIVASLPLQSAIQPELTIADEGLRPSDGRAGIPSDRSGSTEHGTGRKAPTSPDER